MSKGQICSTVILFFREADKVLTGDDVLVYVNDELTPEKVTNATDFYRQGELFAICLKLSKLCSSLLL